MIKNCIGGADMRKHVVRQLTLILWLLIIISCALANIARYREGANIGQQTDLTVQDQQRLTKEALPKIHKDFPAAKNQELQNIFPKLV